VRDRRVDRDVDFRKLHLRARPKKRQAVRSKPSEW
jgi:hypothetical protein